MVVDEAEAEAERDRYKGARDGDHLMCPFQCDLCHFRNIQKRDPGSDPRDEVLQKALRRAILDSFWSRESSTVNTNRLQEKHVDKAMEAYGVVNPPRRKHEGPYPVRDDWGMFEAVCLLKRSLDKGRNTLTIQFNTMRKLRSHFSNRFHTFQASTGMSSLAVDHGATFFTESPTFGFWFKRFIRGCHRRMGDQALADRALTIDEMLAIQTLLEEDWTEAEMTKDRDSQLKIAVMAVSLCLGFSGALRGEEIVKSDLGTTRDLLEESLCHPRRPHVTVGLKGRVKGENHTRCHLLPLVLRSASGIENGKWIQRLVDLYERRGLIKGPLIQVMKEGKLKPAKIADLDPIYHDYLRRIQIRSPSILSPKVDVADEASIKRGPRRGSIGESRNVGTPQEIIDANARWRKVERAGGRQVSLGMMEHYSDVRAIVETLLRYSGPL